MKIAELFNRGDIHALVLDVALLEVFGPEWMSWDPDSIYLAVDRALKVKTSRRNRQKINALSVFHANTAYWDDWRAFENMSWAFMGSQTDLAQITPLSPFAALYGVSVARMLGPHPFSDEVKAYIAAVYLSEQYCLVPVEFAEVQPFMAVHKPHIAVRMPAVRAAVFQGVLPDKEDPLYNAVYVEAAKHKTLRTLVDALSSRDLVIGQSKAYGLDYLTTRVLEGK